MEREPPWRITELNYGFLSTLGLFSQPLSTSDYVMILLMSRGRLEPTLRVLLIEIYRLEEFCSWEAINYLLTHRISRAVVASDRVWVRRKWTEILGTNSQVRSPPA